MSKERIVEIRHQMNRLGGELMRLERVESKSEGLDMVGRFYRIVYTSGAIDYTHIIGMHDSGDLVQNYFIRATHTTSSTVDIAFYLDKRATASSFINNNNHTVKEITKLEFDTALDKAIEDATHNIRKAYNEANT